jgi:hypothetical protein
MRRTPSSWRLGLGAGALLLVTPLAATAATSPWTRRTPLYFPLPLPFSEL